MSALAEMLGEKESRVRSIVYGKQRVPEDFLIKFVKAFQIDANWLLLGVGEPPKPELTPREAALLKNYRSSTDAAQRSLDTTSALLAAGQDQPRPQQGRRPQARGGHDVDTIQIVIQAVEEALAAARKTLPPDKKAELVGLVLEWTVKEGASPTAARVLELVSLVA